MKRPATCLRASFIEAINRKGRKGWRHAKCAEFKIKCFAPFALISLCDLCGKKSNVLLYLFQN